MADDAGNDGGSTERVAYQLLQDVMRAEGRALFDSDKTKKVDRKYLLDTYAECILAVARPLRRVDE
jgi:hypothetical protein